MPIPAVVVGAASRKGIQKGAKKLYDTYRKRQKSDSDRLAEDRMEARLKKMRDNDRKRRAAMKAANKD